MKSIPAILAAGAVAMFTTTALAQEGPAKGTAEAAPASKGNTEVTGGGFEAAKKDDPAKAKDATELSISAGGMQTTGNAQSLALTSLATFRLRRSENQFSALAAGNYGRAAPPGGSVQTTVENFQARARYDRFVSGNFVVFLGLQARRDRFAGLDLRTQVDPGVGYYFINEEKVLLWGELGYDFMYDMRREDARTVRNATGQVIEVLPPTKTTHSSRLFGGYSNKLNEIATFVIGLEYLQSVTDLKIYRFNGDAAFTTKIGKGFSLAAAYTLRYDTGLPTGKKKLDTITSLNLVYTIL